jgi:hypothetical protein
MSSEQNDEKPTEYYLIVPLGTQVVARVETKAGPAGGMRPAGAVGAIMQAPGDAHHAYRICFANGDEVWLRRSEFAILKNFQRQPGAAPADGATETEDALKTYRADVIYRCIVGSRAYRLDNEASDIDYRGIYLPAADRQWSLAGVPEQIQDVHSNEVYWELQKFLTLALKANPNILECLYSPLVEETTELAEELCAMRHTFLSRLIYQSYGGYVFSQFRKLEQDLRQAGTVRWKHAMHLVRRLLSGITALREGYIPVEVGARRDELLAIRHQKMAWDEVNAWRLALHREFDAAFAHTTLPERPDYARADAFLIRARRSRV